MSARRRPPESVAFDQLKGKWVRITFLDGLERNCRLLWVDRFTLGTCWVEWGDESPAPLVMLFKHAIRSLELLP